MRVHAFIFTFLATAGFLGPEAPAYDTTPPTENGDVNGDGAINVCDVVYLLRNLYLRGPDPVPIPALEAEPVTIFFVRHAETNNLECPDVEELSPEGWERAGILAERFSRAELTHVFSSHKIRTRQTVELVAEDHGLDVQQIPALPPGVGECDGEYAGAGMSVDPTVNALLDLPPGSVAMVAGHSSTIIPIMIKLGVPDNFPRDENGNLLKVKGHDNIWVVTLGPTERAETQMVNIQFDDPCPAVNQAAN